MDDNTPPEYVGDTPPEDVTGVAKRSVDPLKCHVEQVGTAREREGVGERGGRGKEPEERERDVEILSR